jgi:hypothetical protein
MLYVGLDIHDKRIAICVLGETGQIVLRAQVRTIDEMVRILEALPDRFEVCYEASCGYGHYHDLLSPIAVRVTVAHPGRLRLIFRSKDKNDRKNAERLAKLLYLGEAPAVHVPSSDVRTWRELITCRGRVIAKRTRAKNSLRTLLRCTGIVPPSRPGLWTKKGLDWLRRLELPTALQRLRRDLLLEEVEALTRQAVRIEDHLNQQAKHSPAVGRLRSIPGVGARTVEAVAAFVRFLPGCFGRSDVDHTEARNLADSGPGNRSCCGVVGGWSSRPCVKIIRYFGAARASCSRQVDGVLDCSCRVQDPCGTQSVGGWAPFA